MNRLDELKVLDEVIANGLDRLPLILDADEVVVLAKHLQRLLAHDRQKAEQTRRAKIKKALKRRET